VVDGDYGFSETTDVEGKNIFIYSYPINGTSWFFLKLIDYNEVYRYLSMSIATMVLLTILLITFLSFAMLVYYYYLRKAEYVRTLVGERQLSKYYKEFQTILYSIGDGVITADVNGCITKMNFIAEELIGIKERSAFGLSIQDVLRICDTSEIDYVSGVLRFKESFNLEKDILKYGCADQFIHVSIIAAPIYNEKDEFQGVVLTIRDKTKEKEAARKILESEERYRMLFNNMTQGFALHNIILNDNGEPIDYLFTDANKSFEQLTGLKEIK
jgi:PAS domain S-box-containing protein